MRSYGPGVHQSDRLNAALSRGEGAEGYKEGIAAIYDELYGGLATRAAEAVIVGAWGGTYGGTEQVKWQV